MTTPPIRRIPSPTIPRPVPVRVLSRTQRLWRNSEAVPAALAEVQGRLGLIPTAAARDIAIRAIGETHAANAETLDGRRAEHACARQQ